jgi:hypothetical protein
MRTLLPARGTPLWLALYAVSLLCVVSFVLFEVLDVDGSDFQPTTSKVAIKVAEAPHEALRRGFLGHGAATLPVPVVTAVGVPPASARAGARPGHRPAPARAVPSSRAALPRALLSDVPPSA